MCPWWCVMQFYWFVISSLKLLSAWRRRAFESTICQCNAACCWWWCKVGFFFWWSNHNTKLLLFSLILKEFCRYLHFDFHHICGHVHFERLSILYDQIEDFFIKNRYNLLWVYSSCLYPFEFTHHVYIFFTVHVYSFEITVHVYIV